MVMSSQKEVLRCFTVLGEWWLLWEISENVSEPIVLFVLFSYLFVCCFYKVGFLCVTLEFCTGIHSVDQAGLELRDLPASAS